MGERPEGRTRCLVVSPATAYGSWKWLEEVIEASAGNLEWSVVAYGRRPPGLADDVKLIALPGGDYLKVGRLMARPALRWLNLLYLLAPCAVATVVALRRRPTVLVGNGIAATIALTPCKWLVGGRLVLAYHGYMGRLGVWRRWPLRWLLSACDGAVANSGGSAEDLRQILRAVTTVEHWAADVFFEGEPLQRPPRQRGVVRIAYVGRTDGEKFGQCRRVCRQLSERGLVSLRVAGAVPPDAGEDGPGVEYLGYVQHAAGLRDLYRWADLTWAPADLDYLSRPGVEALASGCGVLVSDVPAVEGKNAPGGDRIPRSLVSLGCGWVVDGHLDGEVTALLEDLVGSGGSVADRAGCRAYAAAHHGGGNVSQVVRALRGLG